MVINTHYCNIGTNYGIAGISQNESMSFITFKYASKTVYNMQAKQQVNSLISTMSAVFDFPDVQKEKEKCLDFLQNFIDEYTHTNPYAAQLVGYCEESCTEE